MKKSWSKLSILVTGGTGSFGRKFIEVVLKKLRPRRLIVFSRDELKQHEMRQVFPDNGNSPMRYFIGDVRDKDRLKRAFEGVDFVIHAAALKHVPSSEYNPIECIRTNIIGAENVINASMDTSVKKVIALSTDKAVSPINLYGATKLCSDKLFIAANNMKGKRDLVFSIVRYGNVLGSRGSVLPIFLSKRNDKFLPITDKEMTRFNISLEEGVGFVLDALENAQGGEILVPKLPTYKVIDLAQAVNPDCRIRIIGIRPGEKIHEELIAEADSINTYEFDSYYLILPTRPSWNTKPFLNRFKGRSVKKGFKYTSQNLDHRLTVYELKRLVKPYISS